MSTISIAPRDFVSQPTLFVTRKAARSDIAAAIGDALGVVYPYAQKVGAALSGPPFTRYIGFGPGLLTMEIGMPVAVHPAVDGEVTAGALPEGPGVVAVHGGSYDSLHETYSAIERWMEAEGYQSGGAPWEVYVTDPADHPDPADWRTEVYWPLAR